MGLVDFIVIGIIALAVVLALIYIVRAKKSGKKCIGCPDAKNCGGGWGGCAYTCGKNTSDK